MRTRTLFLSALLLALGATPVLAAGEVTITNSGPSQIKAGEALTYTVRVKNTLNAPATGIKIGFNIDSGLGIHEFTTFLGSNKFNCRRTADFTAFCDQFTLGPGQEESIEIYFRVNTDVPCNSNIDSIYDVHPGDNSNITSTWSNAVRTVIKCDENADINVAKAGPGTAQPGQTLTYSVTVSNAGPAAAQNVVINDPIPSGLTFTGGAGCNANGNTVTCNVGTLNANDSRSYTLSFAVPTGAGCGGTISNQATVSTSTPDPNTGNNTSTAHTAIQCPQPQVGCIDVIKETFDTNGNVLTPVTQFSFTLDGGQQVQNDSSGRARFSNVSAGVHTVTENVPASWTQLSVTPPGGSVSVTAGTQCAVVVFKNRQSVQQTVPQCRDGIDNDNDGRIDHPNDPGCDSREDNDERDPAQPYVPQCRDGRDNDNDGRVDHPNDPGCDSRDDDDERDQHQPDVPECRDGRDNDNDGRVDHPNDPGCDTRDDDDERDRRDNDRPQCDDGRDNDRDGRTDYPEDRGCRSPNDDDERDRDNPGNGSVSVDKQADRLEGLPGDEIQFTIFVRNNGGEAARDITLEDSFPSGQMIVADPGGGRQSGGRLTWTIGNVAPGDVRTIRYRMRIDGGVAHGTTLTNTATARGPFGSATDSLSIRVIDRLPQTGIFFGDDGFLTPIVGSGPAVPVVGWLGIAMAGISAGGVLSRRYL